jgi:hypothetical protein
MSWANPLGTEPTPGFYAYRVQKRAPWQSLKIEHDGHIWRVWLGDLPVSGSGADTWQHIPLLARWPFQPISEAEYHKLTDRAVSAKPGDPLATPDRAVDIRAISSVYRRVR